MSSCGVLVIRCGKCDLSKTILESSRATTDLVPSIQLSDPARLSLPIIRSRPAEEQRLSMELDQVEAISTPPEC